MTDWNRANRKRRIIQNEIPSVNAVAGNDSPEKSDDEPPTTVLSTLMLYNKKRLYGYGRKYLNIYVRYILILKESLDRS